MKHARLRLTFLWAILSLFTFAACEPTDPVDGGGNSDKLKISGQRTVTVPATATTATINFTAAGKWTAELANDRPADWISVSPASGVKGECSVTVTIKANETPDERSAVVKITCGSVYETVKVVQKQKDMITLTPSTNEFSAAGGTFTVNVRANVEYSFEVNGSDWIVNAGTRALTDKTTSFTIKPNEDLQKREGSVTVKCALGNETYTIYQSAADPAIVLTSNNVPVPAAGGSVQVEVSSNVTVEMAITAGGEWLTEDATRAMSSHTYYFNATENTSTDPRVGEITFTNQENGLSEKVTVTQMQKNALVVAPAVMEIGASGGTLEIEVSHNTDFEVAIRENWISRQDNGTKAMVTDKLIFTVQANETYDPRENEITFTAGDLVQKVTVRQDAAQGFIPGFESSYTVSANARTLMLSADANVPVEAVSQVNWIRVAESTRGLEPHTIVLEIAANTAESRRSGTVTVSAPSIDKTQTVTVTQLANGEIYIPDANFLQLLLKLFDTDGDGQLSKTECGNEWASIKVYEDPSVCNIESFEGLEFFPNLRSFAIWAYKNNGYNPGGKARGTIDLSANTKLQTVDLRGFTQMDRLNVSGCKDLMKMTLRECALVSDVIFPEDAEKLKGVTFYNCPKYAKDLDLSDYLDIEDVWVEKCPGIKKVILPTGIVLSSNSHLDDGITVEYRGEDITREAVFTDPVLKELLIKADDDGLDDDGDGKITYKDLMKLKHIEIYSNHFDAIQGTVTSLEDLAMFTNLTWLEIADGNTRLSAPLPEALASLEKFGSLSIHNCNITGPIPGSYSKLTKLYNFVITNCPIEGEFPSYLGTLPELSVLGIRNCPNMTGKVTLNLDNTSLTYVYLDNCNFEDITVVAQSADALLHRPYITFYPQLNATGGKVIFRSAVDGTAAVHSDGEKVLYHAATKGPGLDIFITGDGFTSANNTVGGTLETYMIYAAETIMNKEPFNKLMDYFNIWLIYAHSQTEGTAVNDQSTAGQKFGCYQPNYLESSTCIGDYDAICSFVKTSTGRNEPSGTVALIMNSPYHGGMCVMTMTPLNSPGLSVGYVPTSAYFAGTLIHEVMGHGFGKLGDEYGADGASPDQYPSVDNTWWPLYGVYSNFDSESNPSLVRWHAFLSDSRYAAEGLGVYEGANLSNTGWYRPSQNSIMRNNLEVETRFNAPSREAIWQRVQVLTHPEQNWADWSTYVSNGYNREEFVQFDLAASPSAASAKAPLKAARNPLPKWLVKPTVQPVHAPPAIIQ